eukprot:gene12894-7313_t
MSFISFTLKGQIRLWYLKLCGECNEQFNNEYLSKDEYRPKLIFVKYDDNDKLYAVVINFHRNSICYFNDALGSYDICDDLYADYPVGKIKKDANI